jgi:CRP-like cAMP-binding protein
MEGKQLEEIRRLFLFQTLTNEEVEQIAAILHEKKVSSGDKIFSEKDEGDTMYVIKSGSVKITKQREGETTEMVVLSSGGTFGEIALFGYVLRTASAVAVEEASLLEIRRNEFVDFISSHSAIGVKILFFLIQNMAKRLRRLDKHPEEAAFI